MFAGVWERMCVCECVCVRKRERKREKERERTKADLSMAHSIRAHRYSNKVTACNDKSFQWRYVSIRIDRLSMRVCVEERERECGEIIETDPIRGQCRCRCTVARAHTHTPPSDLYSQCSFSLHVPVTFNTNTQSKQHKTNKCLSLSRVLS